MPLYSVYAISDDSVSKTVYDGDDFDEAERTFDAYLAACPPGEYVVLRQPHNNSTEG